MEKRTWQKPELIVLVRNRPEEAVLESCKGDGSFAYNMNVNACRVEECTTGTCDVIAPS
jgi:hypothetical protein